MQALLDYPSLTPTLACRTSPDEVTARAIHDDGINVLHAIRAGAVDFKHNDVLLANHGRLGPSFDLCTKVIIDVLREEGMYNDDGEMVVEVRYDSL